MTLAALPRKTDAKPTPAAEATPGRRPPVPPNDGKVQNTTDSVRDCLGTPLMLQIKTTIPLDHQMNRSATQKIAVISETVLEYSMVDESSKTEHTATYPSQSRVGVDVGGHLFVTSRVTLRKLLTSGLAMLYSRQ